MAHLESRLGIALHDRWIRTYPQFKRCFIHIPNGTHLAGNAQQRARKMARLKAEGLQVGCSDYFIAVPSGDYHGLWLEIKAGKGKPSTAQIEWINMMAEQGYRAEWASGMDQCWLIIEQYMLNYSHDQS